jgi:ferrous iron transport protein B
MTPTPVRPFTIALLGNPNCGKSSLFNRLTGLNQRVGNYPGVTVDRKSGAFRTQKGEIATLIDLPGTYSLYPNSQDERVVADILRHQQHQDYPDLLIMVCDATQLQRSLVLASQALDLGLPTIIVLNMIDILAKESLNIQTELLEQRLKTKVIAISARTGEGIVELQNHIDRNIEAVNTPIFVPPPDLGHLATSIKSCLHTNNDYLAFQALLQPDDFAQLTENCRKDIRKKVSPDQIPLFIADEMLLRHDKVAAICDNVLTHAPTYSEQMTNRIDKVVLHPIGGYFLFGAILLLVFQAIFSWAAYPMDIIEGFFGTLSETMHQNLPNNLFTKLLADGIVAGIGGIAVFVPQIALLFFFIALLEESGYMSRIMFLMDSLLRPFGLSGRSLVPLIGGMACAVPSIMTARTIPNRHERLIAIMVTPLMSCSARIPIYVLIIGMFVPATPIVGIFTLQGIAMMGMYVLGFVTALVSALVFKTLLRYNTNSLYVNEMPIYRMPRWRNVAVVIYQKCRSFVMEAGKVILIISIVLWLAASFGPPVQMRSITQKYEQQIAQQPQQAAHLTKLMETEKLQHSYAGIFGRTIEPIIAPLGFDWKIGIALLTSFAAREVFVGTMATLYSVEPDDENPQLLRQKMQAEINPRTNQPTYTPAVGFALLVFYAFAMQCMSTLAIVKRETNAWKWVLLMLGYMTGLAYVAAWLVFRLLS